MEPAANLAPMAIKGGKGQAGSSVDFWDVGTGATGYGLRPDAEFSELVEVRSTGTDSKAKALGWILGVMLLAVGGYAAYEYFVNERNPIDGVMALIDEHFGTGTNQTVATDPPPKKGKKTKPAVEKVTQAPKEAAAPGDALAGNPYWSLPNKLLGPKTELNRTWSAEEEETWRAGLAHRFQYHHWKTVMDVKERRYKGSEAILWDAMQDKKFWVRMQAAVGLAEFNIEVSLQSLEGALAKARSELVRDFFERYIKRPTPGAAFVMRQAVRLLDERGRLMVLQGIDRSRDELRDLYMAAATQDPSRRVKRWAQEALLSRPIEPDRYNELLKVVSGEIDGANLKSNIKTTAAKNKEKSATKVATEEELEKEMAELEKTGGDVEFYDEAPAETPTDAPDEDTFDYEYESE